MYFKLNLKKDYAKKNNKQTHYYYISSTAYVLIEAIKGLSKQTPRTLMLV